MIFYSIPFAVLFVISSLLFHYAKTEKWQHWVILITNFLFYGYWDIRFLFLLLGIILVCYCSAAKYGSSGRSIYIAICVVACLFALAICKYYNFFIDTFCRAFHLTNRFSLELILPLGISFYTFQALSYVLDVRKGTIPPEKSLVKVAAYISFFPQVTAGPIVKAHDFLPQLEVLHRIKKENVYKGFQLFLLGLTKKIVFADRIGIAVDTVFAAPRAYSGVSILFSIIGYAVQIYCDFSGYSDMAIGIATIWGFDLGKNFNMPYLARNPSDFWKRWHISLSSWFRDYVYIPLGGSRCSKWKHYRNLLITMLLSGFWHGANWTFIIWGLLHGLGSIVCSSHTKGKEPLIRHDWLRIALNNIFVALLWVVFRAESFSNAMDIYAGLFRFNGIHYVSVFCIVYTVMVFSAHLTAYLKNKGNTAEVFLNLDFFRNKVLIAIWLFLILMFCYIGDTAFIYAQF